MSEQQEMGNPANNDYGHATFDRMLDLQAKGPGAMRQFARLLWKSLPPEEQIDYIHDTIHDIGDGPNAASRQDAHLNARVVVEYITKSGDSHNRFHRVEPRRTRS